MKRRSVLLACISLGILLRFFNLGWLHAQHGTRLPDIRSEVTVARSVLLSSKLQLYYSVQYTLSIL